MSKNGKRLAQLVNAMEINPTEALQMFNKSRMEPMASAQWDNFTVQPETPNWRPCPDSVVLRMEAVYREWLKGRAESGDSAGTPE